MRGALLIFVAVLLGAGLLANGFRDNNAAPAVANQTPTTKKGSATTAPGATVTTAVQPHDPAQVKVLVLNGSGKSGVAKAAADQLKAANYTALDPSNAKGGTVTASIVYFVAGYDADAQAVATKLGLPAGAAQPLPTPLPATVADAKDANLVVVVGTDAPIAASAVEAAPTTTARTAATPTTKAATTTTKAAN
jgi:hypothetical protein